MKVKLRSAGEPALRCILHRKMSQTQNWASDVVINLRHSNMSNCADRQKHRHSKTSFYIDRHLTPLRYFTERDACLCRKMSYCVFLHN